MSLPTSVDTLVIGGGTGGAVCAGLLAEHGAESVLLVEAGPDYGPFDDGHWPADLLDARAIPLSHDWGFNSGTALTGRVLDFPRARVVGGCSAHNGCTAVLGARADYDEWERLGATGWGAREMEPLLEMVRARFRVRRYSLEELAPAQAAFVKAGQSVGLPLAEDLDTIEASVGVGPMAANIVDGIRWNSSFAFLDPVRGNRRLTIAGDCLVDRVVVENGVATGAAVIRGGTRHEIRASRVILCAGAYGTPSILLRSGIGPAQDLERIDVPVTVDLPGVGANLLDHPCTQMDFLGSEAFAQAMRDGDWPDEQAVARAKSSLCDEGPYDLHVFIVAGANSGHPGLPPISIYGGAMKGRSQGRLTLRDAQPDSLPLIDPRYLSDPEGHDETVLREARELMTRMTRVPELAQMLGQEAAADKPMAENVVNYCHPAGTSRLGAADDREAVVGPDGTVHGVDQLYVADSSLMPTITRGNINLPTAAIAARIASLVLDIDPAVLANAAARDQTATSLTE
jgi:choline dehydrogenase